MAIDKTTNYYTLLQFSNQLHDNDPSNFNKELQKWKLMSDAYTKLFSYKNATPGSSATPVPPAAGYVGASADAIVAPAYTFNAGGTPAAAANNAIPSSNTSASRAAATSAAARAAADPTQLTAQQVDEEIFGMMAELNRLTSQPTSQANTDLITAISAKLKALAKNPLADPTFVQKASVALTIIEFNPSGYGDFWKVGVVGDPITAMLNIMDSWAYPRDAAPSDPKNPALQNDFLFSQIALFTDFAASGNADLVSRANDFFEYQNSTTSSATLYANFMILYFVGQGYTNDQITAMQSALNITSTDPVVKSFVATLNGFAPKGATPQPTESLADAAAAAAGVFNGYATGLNPYYSNLTPQQADYQIAGMIAAYDRLINNGGPQSAIDLIVAKLKALEKQQTVDPKFADPDFSGALSAVLQIIKDNPTDPTKFNAYWVTNGIIQTLFNDFNTFTPASEQSADDNGDTLFGELSFFADIASKKAGQISDQGGAFFSYFNNTLPGAAADIYASFFVTYLQSQGLSNADITKVAAAYNYSPAENPDGTLGPKEFFDTYIPQYLATPPTITYQQILAAASQVWNAFVNQPKS